MHPCPPVKTDTDPIKALEPFESVTNSRVAMKVIASCSVTESATPSQGAHKNFDVEPYPDANQPYDIHDRVGFVSTSYTANNRTTRLENSDVNLSGTPNTSPPVNGYPELIWYP